MDSIRRKKKMERRKELEKQRDKSDRKKAEIGLVLYAEEGFSFRPFVWVMIIGVIIAWMILWVHDSNDFFLTKNIKSNISFSNFFSHLYTISNPKKKKQKTLIITCIFECFQSHCHILKELHEFLHMTSLITICGKNSFIFSSSSLWIGDKITWG